jgi:hypothetical protein
MRRGGDPLMKKIPVRKAGEIRLTARGCYCYCCCCCGGVATTLAA